MSAQNRSQYAKLRSTGSYGNHDWRSAERYYKSLLKRTFIWRMIHAFRVAKLCSKLSPPDLHLWKEAMYDVKSFEERKKSHAFWSEESQQNKRVVVYSQLAVELNKMEKYLNFRFEG